MCHSDSHEDLKLGSQMIWYCAACKREWPPNVVPLNILERY